MKYWTGKAITKLKDNYVFVFGSNPEGRHGAGAAKQAVKFGAKYGKGRGLHGQTYALVTKNLKAGFLEKLDNGDSVHYPLAGKCSVSLEEIIENIEELYAECYINPDKQFFVAYTSNNNNLNGYSSDEIFQCFQSAGNIPKNIYFHESFK